MNLIHSADIPRPYIEALERSLPGLACRALAPSNDVYASIASHPDIFICAAGGDTLIASPSLPEEVTAHIAKAGMRLIRACAVPRGNYPQTATLNAVRIGSRIFHNTRITDPAIRACAEGNGLDLIHVEQGYARCSTIPVGENALITCDAGIEKAARRVRLDVLRVPAGGVLLPGERYGFIGGASGVMPDGTIVFLGDGAAHPDHDGIVSFLAAHNTAYIFLEGLPLFDAGTLIFFRRPLPNAHS